MKYQDTELSLYLPLGMALFAMFFGAGNMVFPLTLGTHAGNNVLLVAIVFLLSAVGIPFLGLYAVSLYQGNYWTFFSILGKVPAFMVISFLILIIGPLFAAPRTEVITYQTLLPLLPNCIINQYGFSLLYFAVIFLFVVKNMQVVDLIGKLICPVKLIAFISLIVLGIKMKGSVHSIDKAIMPALTHAFETGYATMDLFGAFFYCHVVYKTILHKCQKKGIHNLIYITSIMKKSCIVGALLLSSIYFGFIIIAYYHADLLQGVETTAMITAISHIILGDFGSIFVSICVLFACLATAAALAEVSTFYFYENIFGKRIPRVICLLLVLAAMFSMSILGFANIMRLCTPILTYLYPALIILCIFTIVRQKFNLVSFQRKKLIKAG